MILAKSCHDMDVLSWLMDRRAGHFVWLLMHFREEQAPKVRPTAPRLSGRSDLSIFGPSVLLKRSVQGMGGAFHPGADQAEYHSRASRYGLWPRVYRSDNNVVDHQVVNMEFEGGATAMFSMCGFTYEQERRIQIMGTRASFGERKARLRFTIS